MSDERPASPSIAPTVSDTGDSTPPLGVAGRLAVGLVTLYQRLFAHRPTPCRYVPTCSNYALDALEGHGALRGSWLTARRLCRCHPWGGSGWDPVPPRKASSCST